MGLIQDLMGQKEVKGWLGEQEVKLRLWLKLKKLRNWKHLPFHNVIVPGDNGTTEIDHILVSEFGIFVIETKKMSGWIFGSEKDAKWTRSFAKNRKFSFQNPLRQNYRHIKALSKYLNLPEEKFHSVVCFVGECIFKTPLPSNVLKGRKVVKHILSFQNSLLSEDEVAAIGLKVGNLKLDPALNRREHVKSLNERFQSKTICPKCGSGLKERTAKKGSYAGNRFLGCSTFPKCRYRKNL